jgi:phage tail-like protein
MSYPLPIYHFIVEWGGSRLAFSEVSGLEIEIPPIEYRDGASPEYAVQKMPGLKKYGNVVLKRGIVQGDGEFFDWFKTIRSNTVERRDVTISLLNEDHEPAVIWKVANAWPCKITAPDLKATGNEVAIESLELCHEGLTIEHP